MEIDQKCIDWLEQEIERIQYGEVGIVFKVHQGQVVSCKRISNKTEKIKVDVNDEVL